MGTEFSEAPESAEACALYAAEWLWSQGVRSSEDVGAFLAIWRRCRAEIATAPQYTAGPVGSDDPNAPLYPQTPLPDPQ